MWRAFIYGGDTSNAHEDKAKQECERAILGLDLLPHASHRVEMPLSILAELSVCLCVCVVCVSANAQVRYDPPTGRTVR